MPVIDLSTYKVATGETSSAAKFNNFVQADQNALNALDDANIAVGANVAVAKLAPGTAAQVLTTTGGVAVWATPSASSTITIYDRVVTAVDVNTSVAETTIYSKSISGNDMGTTKTLRLTMEGDYLCNRNTADTIKLRFKFGATTWLADDIFDTTGGISANRQPWKIVSEITNLNAANSQWCSADIDVTRPDATTVTTGIGELFGAGSNRGGIGGPPTATPLTLDTTAAQTLLVSVQWSASSASNSWRMRRALLELV